ncbi:hypothetical protein SNOG_08073 [Parastagonospora nodorum SN15]|uniref:Uncharacterized protein n=1 Tax=Phaeosphaeria nodorum (strain SN15 / ATCC MYA-4574 / FGSC 10173) TaxID=321614 RepID=Q0UJJ1_PHANO|nr:hypothetical protein SNOG_08073 [Parastagonospora nodorum SN15]EAT84349.2 hypothetical protein SNOG_08073 [Parastagonospora nodorum SN15]
MLNIEILGVKENGDGKLGKSVGQDGLNGEKELDMNVDQETMQRNGSASQASNDADVIRHPNGNDVDALPDSIQGLQIANDNFRTPLPHYTPIPSISHTLPNQRPPFSRAPSSHIASSIAPSIQPIDAHAEALRRLGKAERTVKTLKRRGSDESLSSLISYSIRRPSIPLPSRPGTPSLAALAHVLEEAAQEGNLPLVQALVGLGADLNFRSVNRIKNRRHEALNLAAAGGHGDVVEYLMDKGATFHVSEGKGKDGFDPIDYKLLDVAYAGFIDVARYLVEKRGANPFVEYWPREYADAQRTVYRRVTGVRVQQKTLFDALAKSSSESQAKDFLNLIMQDPQIHSHDGGTFIKSGWSETVEALLITHPDPAAYEIPDKTSSEEGQIPSSSIQRHIWPTHALSRETWLYHPQSALRILKMLINLHFDTSTPQHTPDDSSPRTPLARCILANSAAGVDALLSAKPDLRDTDIAIRLLLPGEEFRECAAKPLAAALVQDSLACARVILEHGASVRDPAFGYSSTVVFAAAHGITEILPELVSKAPELVSEALEVAVRKGRVGAVEVLLEAGVEVDERIWDVVVECDKEGKEAEYDRIKKVVGSKLGKVEL